MSTRRLTLRVPVCIEHDGQVFHAYSPAFKGLHMDGRTKKEAMENFFNPPVSWFGCYLCGR